MPTYHIAIVKFYKSREINPYGYIISNYLLNGEKRFEKNNLADQNFVPTIDSVVCFSFNNRNLLIYRHVDEITIPWDEILDYADNNYEIYNEKSIQLINVLNPFLNNISSNELQNLITSLQRKISSDTISDESKKHILNESIEDILFSKALSQSFTTSISSASTNHILYIFDALCKNSIVSQNGFKTFLDKVKSAFNDIAPDFKNIILSHIVNSVSLEIDNLESNNVDISHVLSPEFINFFLGNCFTQEYYKSLSEESGRLFLSVIDRIYDSLLRDKEFEKISMILCSCANQIPEEWCNKIITILNVLLIDKPDQIEGYIEDLCSYDYSTDIFELINSSTHNPDFYLFKEISIAIALVKKDLSKIQNTPYFKDISLKQLLDSLCNDELLILAPYIKQSDPLFNSLFFELIPEKLLPNIFSPCGLLNAESLFSILLDIPEAHNAILEILSKDDVKYKAAKYYSRFSNDLKSSFILSFNAKIHNTKLLLKLQDETTIADELAKDSYYLNNPSLRIRSEMLVDGSVDDYLKLKEKRVIDEISPQCIKSVIERSASLQEQSSILNKFGLNNEEQFDFLITEMPNSDLIRIIATIIVKDKIERFIDNLQEAIVFDIEGKEEKHNGTTQVFAWDYAYKRLRDREITSYKNSRKKRSYLNDTDWDNFGKKLLSAELLIGHNIKRWDLDLLKVKCSDFNETQDLQIWDTLEVEVVLNPERNSYALNALNGHIASNDVKTNELLFFSQLKKIIISQSAIESVKDIIPTDIFNSIKKYQESISKYISHTNSSNIEDTQKYDSCFYGNPEIENLCGLIDNNSSKKILIVAHQSFWPQIAKECEVVDFKYPTGTAFPYCACLNCDLIVKNLNDTNDIFKRNLYLRAKRSSYEHRILHCSDLPSHIFLNIGKECLKRCFDNNQKPTVTCIEPNNFESFKLDEYGSVHIIGDQLLAERQALSNDEYQRLRDYVIATKAYSPFNFRYDIPNNSINEIVDSNSELYKYRVYQNLKGGLALYRYLDVDSVKKYCSERKIPATSKESPKTSAADNISILINNDFALPEKFNNEDDFLKAWYYSLSLFDNYKSNYPKVLIVETKAEAASIANYYLKKKKKDFKLNKQLYERLDETDEGKLPFCILSIDELKPNNQVLVEAKFTIILCNLFSLENGKDSITFLYELQTRIKQYCSSFDIAIILSNNHTQWREYCKKQVTFDDKYKKHKTTLKQCFLNYVDTTVEFDEHLEDLKENGVPVKLLNPKSNQEEQVKEHKGKMLQWIERNLLDNKYTGKKLKAIQIKALSQSFKYKGNNNVFLTVMPTGYGKSIIFQGPALYKKIKLNDNKLNIVISPLQALMRDQVYGILGVEDLIDSVQDLCKNISDNQDLTKRIKECKETIDDYLASPCLTFVSRLIGQAKAIIKENNTSNKNLVDRVQHQIDKYNKFENTVAYINATTTHEELEKIQENIKRRKLALLYIAPERLMNRHFFKKYIIDNITNTHYQGIGSFIFDEAHCITGWGMDFRPSYIFALRKIQDVRVQHPEIPIHLFTATLPKQAKIELSAELQIDEENIIPREFNNNDINTLNDSTDQLIKEEFDAYQKSICPIQEHISTNVIHINDGKNRSETFNNKIERITRLLSENPLEDDKDFFFCPTLLCPEKSRMIVFTYSRRDAIEGSALLAEKLKKRNLVTLSEHIAFFHAGLERGKKDAIIEEFKNGKILILFSTKAFGLGMDIPNIHYVIHLTPPTYIEDYLQEVGRAGRDLTKYKEVFPTFDGKHPKIKAICLYSNEDIKRNKDRISKIKWGDVSSSYKQIISYIKDAGLNDNDFAVVPKNLLEYNPRPRQATNDEDADLKDIFMQSLIWLSKGKHLYENEIVEGLDCIEIGSDCPNSYDINILNLDTNDIIDQNLKDFLDGLKEIVPQPPCRYILESNSIIGKFGIKTISDIELLIDEGVKCGKLSKDFMYLSIKLWGKGELSSIFNNYPELKGLDLKEETYSKSLLSAIKGIRSNGEIFEKFADIKDKIENHNYNISNSEDSISIFKELSLLYPIDEIINKCYCLLVTSLLKKTEALSWKTISDVTGTINDERYAKLILVALNKLKFIDLGNITTDYIEVRIKKNGDVSKFPQAKTTRKELKAFKSAKENKSGAMCALIEFMNNPPKARESLMESIDKNSVNNMDDSEIFKEYIKIYSKCSLNEIEDSILLKNFKNLQSAARNLNTKIRGDKAVKPELDGLQRSIYDGPDEGDEHYLNNFNVLAGAGSGKTRLLSYWALKLILAEYVEDKSILILAYNRAVRDTILHRVTSYALDVGYTLRNPQVFTFHEFALSMLKEQIADQPFDKWEEALLCDIINNPSKYHEENQYRFILVDEFQDITSTRLAILKKLISDGKDDPNCAHVFFVGDYKQSIYGYEKRNAANSLLRNVSIIDAAKKSNNPTKFIKDMLVFKPKINVDIDEQIGTIIYKYKERDKAIKKLLPYISINPQDYYGKFAPIKFAKTKELINNYRSTKEIIDLASEWLDYQAGAKMKSCNAKKYSSTQKIEGQFNSEQLNNIIEEIPKLDDIEKQYGRDFKKEPFEIGILFRCNAELYEANDWICNWVKNHGKEFSIRIQGSDIYYSNTREFYHFGKLLSKSEKQITAESVERITQKDFTDIEEGERSHLNAEIIDVAKQLINLILTETPTIDNKSLLAKFWHIASSEREHLKLTLEMAQRQQYKRQNSAKFNIILSVIHRSKGLEYDAVIIPSSQLPIQLSNSDMVFYNNNEQAKSLLLNDLFEEERRLMYVAYSRAKDLLFYQIGVREKAILMYPKESSGFEGDNNKIYAPDGLGNVDMGYASCEKCVHTNLATCEVSDQLILKGEQIGENINWFLYKEEGPEAKLKKLGKLSKNNEIVKNLRLNHKYSGLKIKSINVVSEIVTKESKIKEIKEHLEKANVNIDLINTITSKFKREGFKNIEEILGSMKLDDNIQEMIKSVAFAKRVWNDEAAIKRGYVYYIDYYGYIEKDND